MLPKNNRLSSKEISLLPQDRKRRIKTDVFDFVVFPSVKTKFAFLISTKFVKKAVVRNLLKRRLAKILSTEPRFFNLQKAVLVIVKRDFSKLTKEQTTSFLEAIIKNQ